MTSQASSSATVIAFPHLVARNWWRFLSRGLAAITFGLLSLIWPGISLVTLILLFKYYAMIEGVFALAQAIFGRGNADLSWWLVLVGLVGIGVGITTIVWPCFGALSVLFGILLSIMPGAGAVPLIWLIAVFAIAFGILMVGFAFMAKNLDRARPEIVKHE